MSEAEHPAVLDALPQRRSHLRGAPAVDRVGWQVPLTVPRPLSRPRPRRVETAVAAIEHLNMDGPLRLASANPGSQSDRSPARVAPSAPQARVATLCGTPWPAAARPEAVVLLSSTSLPPSAHPARTAAPAKNWASYPTPNDPGRREIDANTVITRRRRAEAQRHVSSHRTSEHVPLRSESECWDATPPPGLPRPRSAPERKATARLRNLAPISTALAILGEGWRMVVGVSQPSISLPWSSKHREEPWRIFRRLGGC